MDTFDIMDTLPLPPWWDGPCDAVRYKAATGITPHPLNEGYKGVFPCGPRPLIDRVPDIPVAFPGGTTQFEWECTELSKRWLYLAYGIPAYKANGYEIVRNYRPSMQGEKLTAIPNDNAPPCPQPGDVLAYGLYSPGHTSVCISASIDVTGYGFITVMEQNNSASGQKLLPVRGWKVIASPPVTAFLHKPKGDTPVPPPPTNTQFFPETGHNLSNAFLAYWLAEPKALSYWGFPISEEIREILSDGQSYTVQYFERARFEYHPELQSGSQVLLGLVGAELETIRMERHPQGD